MGPLLTEIMEILKPTKQCSTLQDMKDWNLPRLHLISGHDSTLMPILASFNVWDGRWTPYASMLIIESYALTTPREEIPSNHVFRLLYNGQVLTFKFPGCPPDSELCDLDVFLRYVEPFATRNRNCKPLVEEVEVSRHQMSLGWTIVVALAACVLGSVAACVTISRMNPRNTYSGINEMQRSNSSTVDGYLDTSLEVSDMTAVEDRLAGTGSSYGSMRFKNGIVGKSDFS